MMIWTEGVKRMTVTWIWIETMTERDFINNQSFEHQYKVMTKKRMMLKKMVTLTLNVVKRNKKKLVIEQRQKTDREKKYQLAWRRKAMLETPICKISDNGGVNRLVRAGRDREASMALTISKVPKVSQRSSKPWASASVTASWSARNAWKRLKIAFSSVPHKGQGNRVPQVLRKASALLIGGRNVLCLRGAWVVCKHVSHASRLSEFESN